MNWQLAHQGWGRSVTVDGVVGPKTAAAIKSFQRGVNAFYDKKVLTVDGVLGQKSWAQLCVIHGEVGYSRSGPNSLGLKLMREAGCSNPG